MHMTMAEHVLHATGRCILRRSLGCSRWAMTGSTLHTSEVIAITGVWQLRTAAAQHTSHPCSLHAVWRQWRPRVRCQFVLAEVIRGGDGCDVMRLTGIVDDGLEEQGLDVVVGATHYDHGTVARLHIGNALIRVITSTMMASIKHNMCIASFRQQHHTCVAWRMKSCTCSAKVGGTRPRQWCGTPAISASVALLVTIGRPAYNCAVCDAMLGFKSPCHHYV